MTFRRLSPPAIALLLLLGLSCNTLLPAPTPTPVPSPTTGDIPEDTAEPVATPIPQPTLTADPAQSLETQREAMLLEFAGDVDKFQGAARYFVDVIFEPGSPATLRGRQRVIYANPESVPLDDIALHLYVNTSQFLGSVTLGRVWVNGQSVEPDFVFGETAVRLTLPAPLPPGQSADIALEWVVTVEDGLERAFARFGEAYGVYSMPSFIPLVARRVDGDWDVGVEGFTGDPVSSDTALFELRITVPEGPAVIASGTLVAETANGDGTRTLEFVTGPMRDVALVVGPLLLSQSDVNGTTVNVWLLESHAEFGPDLHRVARDSLVAFTDLLGPYPYDEIDYVDVPGFGGIEFPGLMLIGTVGDNYYTEIVVAHETAHEWFYGIIGDDQLREPWLDEGLASYLEVVYFEAVHGTGESALADHEQNWRHGADNPNLPVGLPVNSYPSEADYFSIVYSKSVTFLDELRGRMGEAAFADFMGGLYDDYRYEVLTTAGFQASAETACSCELDDLFALYVTTGGPVEDQ